MPRPRKIEPVEDMPVEEPAPVPKPISEIEPTGTPGFKPEPSTDPEERFGRKPIDVGARLREIVEIFERGNTRKAIQRVYDLNKELKR